MYEWGQGESFFISQKTRRERPQNLGDQTVECQQQLMGIAELLACFLFHPEGAIEWFPGTWLGPSNLNVEPCKKRLTFQNKCVTHKTGHFQKHLATDPDAGWSLWPQGVTCRSDVNRWQQQSLGQATLLTELGLQIILQAHWSELLKSCSFAPGFSLLPAHPFGRGRLKHLWINCCNRLRLKIARSLIQ